MSNPSPQAPYCHADQPGNPLAPPPVPESLAPIAPTPPNPDWRELGLDVEKAIQDSVEWLRQNQYEDGHWVGFLKTNSAIEAEWIMAMYYLGIEDDPKYAEVVRAILSEQRPDGSWEVYYNAPTGDINATVESYVALRIAGHSPQEPHMEAARRWILSHGGLSKVRVFTRYWLALLGEWPWEKCPNLPPEFIFLPPSFPINLYTFASWGRATIAALCLISADRPSKPLPPEKRLDELFPQGRQALDYSLPPAKTPWGHFFAWADKFLGWYTSYSPFKPWRRTAIKLCTEWVVARQERDGCWAGIQPPWIYALIGLYTQGYALDHPVLKAGLEAFNEPWAYKTERGTYLQCCTSPVWDTVLSLVALHDCQVSSREEMVQKAVDYTLRKQIRRGGDWQVNTPPSVEPGGWAFEYENDNYPDIDDSAVALSALLGYRGAASDLEKMDGAIKRGLRWIRALQSSNGGWGAFDKDNDQQIICQIPFADFGEVLDPPSTDVTAHVLEALAAAGKNLSNSLLVRQGVDFIRREQEEDGSWFGRWGVNHVYGTGLVLPGLQAAGVDMQAPWVEKAAQWLVDHQNSDGGWGESCASYMSQALRGVGPSTPCQTGWALMGLLAMGDHRYDQAIARGLQYLVSTQKDGTWEQKEYTGTGFPGYGFGARSALTKDQVLDQGQELSRGFMLNYAMYRHYFPMMALGRARRHFNF